MFTIRAWCLPLVIVIALSRSGDVYHHLYVPTGTMTIYNSIFHSQALLLGIGAFKYLTRSRYYSTVRFGRLSEVVDRDLRVASIE